MTRGEVVVLWRTVHQEEGLRVLWHSLWERYFVAGLGELHDPEFVACMECGVEFELVSNGWGHGHRLRTEFCDWCAARHRRDCVAVKAAWPQLRRAA